MRGGSIMASGLFFVVLVGTGLLIFYLFSPTLVPLKPQNRDYVAEIGEKLAKRLEIEKARREARLRGEPVPDWPKPKKFPRDQLMKMTAPTTAKQRQIKKWLEMIESRSSLELPEPGTDGDPYGSLNALHQLQLVVALSEIQRLYKFDKNRDGILNRAELERSRGRDRGPIRSPFRSADEILKADRNGDDQLTLEELLDDAAERASIAFPGAVHRDR